MIASTDGEHNMRITIQAAPEIVDGVRMGVFKHKVIADYAPMIATTKLDAVLVLETTGERDPWGRRVCRLVEGGDLMVRNCKPIPHMRENGMEYVTCSHEYPIAKCFWQGC
jgi:hypothetical protein